jgi:hypothetical protein
LELRAAVDDKYQRVAPIMAPTSTTLADVERHEKDQKHVELNGGTATGPLTMKSEKEDPNKKTNDEGIATVETPAQDRKYPQGVTLFFIVAALVLAIFLNSLDIVGFFLDSTGNPRSH